MFDSPIFLGFCAFLLDFFKIQRCFMDCRVKFYIGEVFFLEEWFLALQNFIFPVFSIFSRLV